jgi:hypothetical protein
MRTADRARRGPRSVALLVFALCLVVLTASALPAAGAVRAGDRSHETAAVIGTMSTNYTGEGIAARNLDNTTYVWADGQTQLEVTVYPTKNRAGDSYQICLQLVADGTTAVDHGCKRGTFRTYGTKETFALDTLGTNETGPYALHVALETNGETVEKRIPVYIIQRDGDLDGDGLSNAKEFNIGTDVNATDTDQDGAEDGPEVNEYKTDPLSPDTDNDGARDFAEIQDGTDPNLNDTDGDTLLDGDELNNGTNPNKTDTDGDGLDDNRELKEETDPLEPDTDGDGLIDGRELTAGTDPLEPDTDGDGIEDGPEVENGTDPLVKNPATATPGNETSTPKGGAGGMETPPPFWLGIGALALAGAGVVAYSRREERPDDDGPIGPVGAAALPADGEPVDVELMSPEQRVGHLLSTHDGQLKQSTIVELTDWSKAKVSRTLSSMEENGEIERIRIGRENLVTTPGNGPGKDL